MSSHSLAPFITASALQLSTLPSPAPLVEELGSSAAQTAWTNLKEVFKAVRDASDLFLPLKIALSAVIPIMDLIDVPHVEFIFDAQPTDCEWSQRVGDVNDEFVRVANNVKGFQGIFSQYASEQEISPAVRSRLDAVISSVVAVWTTTAALLIWFQGTKFNQGSH
jgi:hypothetical protein